MSIKWRDLSFRTKLSALSSFAVLISVFLLVAMIVWLSEQYYFLAQKEVDLLIQSDLDHITEGVYNMVRTEDEAIQLQVDQALSISRYILAAKGKIHFQKETVTWKALDQFTRETKLVQLPRICFVKPGSGTCVEAMESQAYVQEVSKLTGGTVTVFQRMNPMGDMLRISTTVLNSENQPAVGTFIPAVNPDQTPNPVISAIINDYTYKGRAYVVNDWYLTSYEPLKDAEGKIIGMLYVGVKQKQVESRIRQAILQTRVGKTGYVYVLGGQGAEQGHYVISQGALRDGENVWESRDSDGRLVIQEIVRTARALKPGEMATQRYRWQNPGETVPRWKIARLTYYSPWDWVIGTSVYEDELQEYQKVLKQGKERIVWTAIILGAVTLLFVHGLILLFARSITRPIRQITDFAVSVSQGDLERKIEIQSGDEIGILGETFNTMVANLRRSMSELRQSEERHRALFEEAYEGLMVTSFDGRILQANPAMAQILGYESPEELQEVKSLPDQIYAYPQEYKEWISTLLQTGAPMQRELQFCRKDGRKIWVFLGIKLVRNSAGEPTHIQGFVTDVTENKSTNEKLKAAKRQLENVIGFLPDPTIIVDQNRSILVWNRAMEELTGVPEKEMLGKPGEAAAFLFYGDTRKMLLDFIDEEQPETGSRYSYLKRKGKALLGEGFAPNLNQGKGAYLLAIASPLYDSEGSRIGAIESFRDVTEQKNVDLELRFINTILKTQQENAPYGILIIGPKKNILSFNQKFVDIWKISRRLAIGDSDDDLLREILPQLANPDEFRQKVQFLYEHPSEKSEDELRFADGRVLERYSAPLYGSEGTYYGRVWNFFDITERKQAEEKRAHLELQLHQSQKMESIGQLAGGIAHDFNNLLTPILGYTQLMLQDISPRNPHYDYLQQIREAGEGAKTLTRQLLAFSRKQVLELREIDLVGIVQNFQKILRRTIREDIRIIVKMYCGESFINSDPNQIEQILMNLAVNAQDAMPKGGSLEISVDTREINEDYAKSHPEISPGPYVVLAVSDTGTGMDPETQNRIFEPFFTTKESGQGTGLGLSTVFGIVKQHGGGIVVYSVVGKGSTFQLFFPRISKTDSFKSRQEQDSPDNGMFAHPGETILVVEDEQAVRDLTVRMLGKLRYETLVAETPQECFRSFEENKDRISLLLTDVILPGMNGKEMYQCLAEGKPGLKVIFMSGYTDELFAHHGILPQGTHFLQKPVSFKDLAKKIRTVLDS